MKHVCVVLLVIALLAIPLAAPATAPVDVPGWVQSVLGPYALQTTATTGNGLIWETGHRLHYAVVWVKWSAGCGAGAVAVQVAPTKDWAGTWQTLRTITYGVDIPDWYVIYGPVGAIRTPVTSTVTGGTVSVDVYGW